MEIEQSSLIREIDAIINGDVRPVHFLWTAIIHVDGVMYNPLKLLSIDFSSNYIEHYADEIIVKLAIPGGTYSKRIYPFKEFIEITLIKNPLNEVGNDGNEESSNETERYTATLKDSGNPLLEANGNNSPSEDSLNLTSIVEVEFQLVNKALEQLRMVSVGGIYRDALVEDVIRGILTKESDIVVVDDVELPVGVNMVEASNTNPRDHIIIPQGTMLVDIPGYVQQNCGGVYSSGLGYYFQNDYWYIYPCFDTTRFSTSDKTLTVINVPTNKFPSIERTYRLDGKNLVVLATGEVRFRDDSESQQLNDGNGVRFADAGKFMNGFTKTENNKTTANREETNTEFVSVERKNGNNNVKVSDNAITSNAMVEYSKLAARQGSTLTFVWENSQPSLIFPGMMVKVLYLEEDIVKEVYGVILKAHHYVQTKNKGIVDPRHILNTALSIFVQRISAFKEEEASSYEDSEGNTIAIPPPEPTAGSSSKMSGPSEVNSDTFSSVSSVSSSVSTARNTVASINSSVGSIKGAISNIGSASASASAIAARLGSIGKW